MVIVAALNVLPYLSFSVPLPVGVGVESGDIPDNQLTSSSEQGPGYGAQYSRLNSKSGEGAWCAGSCNLSDYLQIDLGLVHLLREVRHSDIGIFYLLSHFIVV